MRLPVAGRQARAASAAVMALTVSFVVAATSAVVADAGDVLIDTERVTWRNLSLHPDRCRIMFDALGALYHLNHCAADPPQPFPGDAFRDQYPRAVTHSPLFSPDGERVAFISDAGGRENLWVAPVNRGPAQRLTDFDGVALSGPTWTPDGERIVLRVRVSARRGRIAMIQADPAPASARAEAVWLPTRPRLRDLQGPWVAGQSLWFATTGDAPGGSRPLRRETWQIARMPVSGGRVEKVTDEPGGAVRPRLSPSGRYFGYVGWRDGRSLLVVRDREAGAEVLTHPVGRNLQDLYIAQLDLFPAYTLTERAAWVTIGGVIHRLPFDGAAKRIDAPVRRTVDVRRAEPRPVGVPEDGQPVRVLRWPSADAGLQRIVFDALGQVWRIERSAGGWTKPAALTPPDDNCAQPDLSADGQRVAMVCEGDAGRWRLERWDKGERTTIAADDYAWSAPRWMSRERLVAVRGAPEPRVGLEYPLARELVRIDTETGRMDVMGEFDAGSGGFRPAANCTVVGRDGDRLVRVDDAGSIETVAALGDARQAVPGPDGDWLVAAGEHVAQVDADSLEGHLGSATTPGFAERAGHVGRFPVWVDDASWLYSFDGDLWRVGPRRGNAGPERIPVDLAFDPAGGSGKLVLDGARIVTMGPDGVIDPGRIVIDGERIVAVGPRETTPAPAGARRFDQTGHTILPGLIDVHQHALYLFSNDPLRNPARQFTPPAALLAYGITSTRDPALMDNGRDFAMIEQINAGRIRGPRYFATGQRLRPAEYTLTSKADARAAVAQLVAAGAVSIKQYLFADRRQRRWVAEAAREAGVHATFETGYDYKLALGAILDGYNGLEHTPGNHRLHGDFVELARASGIEYTPTIMTQIGADRFFQRVDLDQQPRLRRWIPASWRLALRNRTRRGSQIAWSETAYGALTENAAQMAAAGVTVGVGAHDTPSPTGLGTHWEIQALVEGGLAPGNALRAATIDGARIIGIEEHAGSIEPGKLADLLIVEGNPLEDITATQDAHRIVFRGRLLDPLTLETVKETAP